MNSPSAKSSVSPGRNGKNSPHSTKTMSSAIQMNDEPYSCCSHSGSSHLMPRRSGCMTDPRSGTTVTAPRYPGALWPVCAVPRLALIYRAGVDERAPYDPMPYGPDEVGVGPWEGPWPEGE